MIPAQVGKYRNRFRTGYTGDIVGNRIISIVLSLAGNWRTSLGLAVPLAALCSCAEFDYPTVEREIFFDGMSVDDSTVRLGHLVFEDDAETEATPVASAMELEEVSSIPQIVAVSVAAQHKLPISLFLAGVNRFLPQETNSHMRATIDGILSVSPVSELGQWAMWRGVNQIGLEGEPSWWQ